MKARDLEVDTLICKKNVRWLVRKVEVKGAHIIVHVVNGEKHDTFRYKPGDEVEAE